MISCAAVGRRIHIGPNFQFAGTSNPSFPSFFPYMHRPSRLPLVIDISDPSASCGWSAGPSFITQGGSCPPSSFLCTPPFINPAPSSTPPSTLHRITSRSWVVGRRLRWGGCLARGTAPLCEWRGPVGARASARKSSSSSFFFFFFSSSSSYYCVYSVGAIKASLTRAEGCLMGILPALALLPLRWQGRRDSHLLYGPSARVRQALIASPPPPSHHHFCLHHHHLLLLLLVASKSSVCVASSSYSSDSVITIDVIATGAAVAKRAPLALIDRYISAFTESPL